MFIYVRFYQPSIINVVIITIFIIIIIIVIIIIIIISSLSSLMLFPGKECHNSRHQPLVLGIIASFFFFIFFFFSFHIQHLFVLFSPFQINKTSVILQSSSPSLISRSISQSALLLFLMPLLVPI